jgi:hypothetical protein
MAGALVATPCMRMKPTVVTTALILAVPSSSGCGGSWHTVTPIPIRPTNAYALHAQEGGLSAAADPFDTDAKVEMFGSKKLPHSFTPILLVVENSEAEKLYLDRRNAKLICADGTMRKAVSALSMYEQLRDESDDAYVFSTPFYLYVLENNDRMKTDWMAKEFPAETILTQGRRTAGLLYFRGKCGTQGGRKLHITVDKLTSPGSIKLDLDLG